MSFPSCHFFLVSGSQSVTALDCDPQGVLSGHLPSEWAGKEGGQDSKFSEKSLFRSQSLIKLRDHQKTFQSLSAMGSRTERLRECKRLHQDHSTPCRNFWGQICSWYPPKLLRNMWIIQNLIYKIVSVTFRSYPSYGCPMSQFSLW